MQQAISDVDLESELAQLADNLRSLRPGHVPRPAAGRHRRREPLG